LHTASTPGPDDPSAPECAANEGTANRDAAPPTGSDPRLDDAQAARVAACAVNVPAAASVSRISRANIPRGAFLTRVATRGTRRCRLWTWHSPAVQVRRFRAKHNAILESENPLFPTALAV